MENGSHNTPSNVSSSSSLIKTWVFYYFQGEEGEDRSHPNAYIIQHSKQNSICLKDVLTSFPHPNPLEHFHFRFRLNHSKTGTFFWLDISQPDKQVPLCNGRIICKILRLKRLYIRQGLILRKKTLRKWEKDSIFEKNTNLQQPNNRTKHDPIQDHIHKHPLPQSKDNDSSFHRSSSSPSFTKNRPQPYSDSPGEKLRSTHRKQLNESVNGTSKSRSRSSSPTKFKSPNGTRTIPRKTIEKTEDSLEDFISGGSPSSQRTKNESKGIDLMGGGWDDKANSSMPEPQSGMSRFMSSMDPLSSSPTKKPTNKGNQNHFSSNGQNTNQFNEGGQTVGPVTLKEMEEIGIKSTNDGSNVWNPNLVDKTTKSDNVRYAMEQRELKKQHDMNRAKEELRQREEANKQLEIQKQQTIDALGPRLKQWAEDNGRKKNIRTLLSTMHLVMWEGSKWKEVSMAKLLNPIEVKKAYRRAMLVVHPDKNGGRTAEQLVIAERIFDAVNSAWDEFMKTEM